MKNLNLKDKKDWIIAGALLVIIGLVYIIFNITGGSDTGIFKPKVNIELSKVSELELVDYECNEITMKIPQGWVVETAGENMYFSIRVYDPNDDRYQIYSILKAEPLLKNQKAKNWYENYYNLFGGDNNKLLAKAIVVPSGTVEEFYSSFNDYVNYAKEIGSTFNAPDLKNFVTVESFENNSLLKSVAKDDKVLRGTFQDSKTGKNGEGLFMASIVDVGSNTSTLGYDVLYYMAYNVMGITTGEYDLVNYQDILTKSLNSLTYKESFINATIKNGQEQTKQALSINATVQEAYDSYNRAWTNRQKSYDIISQKNSDATLGYIRVYDKENGDTYKAYNGFLDDYSGNRYVEATDDMYTKSVKGYIEK